MLGAAAGATAAGFAATFYIQVGSFLGILAGQNTGTISNVHVSGTVSGGSYKGLQAGGLVGVNAGTINNNTSTVAGTITQSSSSASVTLGDGGNCTTFNCGPGNNLAGGLVGFNPGTITQSWASSSASTAGPSTRCPSWPPVATSGVAP